MSMIRAYVDQDAPLLAAIHNRVFPNKVYGPDGFRELVQGTLAGGGLAWVVAGFQLSGYALLTPVPGLNGVGDLTGCITPERRRIGLGSQLLRFVLAGLQATDFRQIAHFVTDLDSPGARFLLYHDFYVEHEEWLMELDNLDSLAESPGADSTRLQTFPRQTAVSLFCRLYAESFSGLPWDQPFTRSEVVAALPDSRDMLFVTLDGEPIGFAWIGLDANGHGLIEPLGIVSVQQHRGYGRTLLGGAVRELAKRGAKRVQISAWRNNEAAIHLYRSLGFRHCRTFTYLAIDLKERQSP
jgi:ribosomal protein S18 acetylase RimI-like enzyme